MFRQSCSVLRSVFLLDCPPRSSVFLLCAITLLITGLQRTHGMQVASSGPRTIQKAEGEKVNLDCSYTPSPTDTGELDIEWSVVSPDTTQKDQMLMSYAGGIKYVHADNVLAKGLTFAASDPSTGDASLSIATLSPAHSGTYQCKVKKSPGVDTLKVSLKVLAKPSVPKCWVEGGEMHGEAVSLHCKSAKGSPPLKYTWRRESPGPMPTEASQNSVTGELKITNHSQSFAGIYLCEVNNAVGAERCRIILKANKPPNKTAVIVGVVVGSLLLIFILCVFIVLLYWKLRSKQCYEKEFSNEIREDVPPPESRPVSRRTNRSSGRHPQVTYSHVGETEASCLDQGHARTPSTTCSHVYTPVKYNSKDGYAV